MKEEGGCDCVKSIDWPIVSNGSKKLNGGDGGCGTKVDGSDREREMAGLWPTPIDMCLIFFIK